MITPRVENDDATSSSTTPKSQPTPALVVEYRSYTSDYEDELRKLRNNSRGVSFDTTNADTSKPATASESNEKSDKDPLIEYFVESMCLVTYPPIVV